jgi:2'-5' RNA ligase
MSRHAPAAKRIDTRRELRILTGISQWDAFFMRLYFIALVLPDELNEEILVFKNLMAEKWGSKVALKSPAHITLVPPFRMEPGLEENLLRDLDELGKTIAPFSVTTHNFSAFKPRTIFIQPVIHEPLKTLKRKLDTFCKTHAFYGARADTRLFHPHITIATRDLEKQAFAEAWPHFEKQSYNITFGVAGISTLRHNSKNWDVIHTSLFVG